MVGEFIGQREAEPQRSAIVADKVYTGDLSLLATVERKTGAGKRRAARHDDRAVALPEPFRIGADLTRCRLAAVKARLEHLHRIGEIFTARELRVHLVACLGAAEMRQPGAANQAMRRIGVIDRCQHTVVGNRGAVVFRGIAKVRAH